MSDIDLWEIIEAKETEIERLRKERSELLEALEACLSWVEGMEQERGEPLGAGNMARTAISKAKGEA